MTAGENPQKNIAVIGGGIAGLGAAWSLSQRHRVTIYERSERLGGHANTVEFEDNGTDVAVDTGFIVYNAPNYPNLVALFEQLEVPTHASDMSFGVSLHGGRLEYGGADFRALFAQPSNLLKSRFWTMLRDIKRFYGSAMTYRDGAGGACSIAELLQREKYSTAFVDDHLMPMAAAIWSASKDDIGRYPAAAFIRFFDNHGLLQLHERPQWRTVRGGSREYVSRLTDSMPANVRTNTAVAAIRRDAAGAHVTDGAGHTERFDEVVIATSANQALSMMAAPSVLERQILGAFSYSPNIAYLHEDSRFMPRRRAAWSSWNYLQPPGTSNDAPLCVTYWMNRLQPLATKRQLFVTLNPMSEPAQELTHGAFYYEHPIFTAATARARERSIAVQGHERTWYCGSYFGHGFHEDALQSGLWVAEQLGCERPFSERGEFDRLPDDYRLGPRPALALSA